MSEERMKLSQAILRGSRVTSPCKGRYFVFGPLREDGSHDIMGACARGAALIGILGFEEVALARLMAVEEEQRIFPEMHALVTHPLTDGLDVLSRVISELNDDGDWSREDIADWLSQQGL